MVIPYKIYKALLIGDLWPYSEVILKSILELFTRFRDSKNEYTQSGIVQIPRLSTTLTESSISVVVAHPAVRYRTLWSKWWWSCQTNASDHLHLNHYDVLLFTMPSNLNNQTRSLMPPGRALWSIRGLSVCLFIWWFWGCHHLTGTTPCNYNLPTLGTKIHLFQTSLILDS